MQEEANNISEADLETYYHQNQPSFEQVLAKETLSFEDAKAEIRSQMASQRYRESMKSFQGGVVFNDAYFVSDGSQVPHSHHRQSDSPSQREQIQK